MIGADPGRRFPLPPQATPLLGRDAEVAEARRMLLEEGVRLLTLTGPAGTGKTRLALGIAGAAAGAFADGTCFVDLAAVHDPRQVLPAIAQALGVRIAGGKSVATAIGGSVQDKRLLLVLDNFEQVLPAAPGWASCWRRARRSRR